MKLNKSAKDAILGVFILVVLFYMAQHATSLYGRVITP
jgi:hypothetical protein